MATYKQTVGTAVTNYAGDKPNVVEGELWYDSTNKDFKYQYPNTTSAWSTGGSLNTAKGDLGNAGTQTATLSFGGEIAPITAQTEQYNGTSWTEVAELTTTRGGSSGNGTGLLGFTAGGEAPPGATTATEEWTVNLANKTITTS